MRLLRTYFALCGWLALGFCAFGIARTTEAGKPAAADAQRRVRAAITQGRKLVDQGKNREAIAVFQSALALDPMAVKALSELGLVYYRLGQYVDGESSTRKAIKATTDPGQRGRSLYNLGIILEAKGDRQGAVAALEDSLRARPHSVVLERLRKLDAAAAAALDPVAPRKMSGPFATLQAVCQQLDDCKQRMTHEESNAGPRFSCQTKRPLAQVAKPVAPYRSVQLIQTKCGPEKGDGDQPGHDTEESIVYLVIQTEKGFFSTSVAESYANSRGGSDIALLELKIVAGLAGASRIYARIKESGGRDVGQGSDSWEREKLTIAGIGASGTPSATPPLHLASLLTEDSGDSESSPPIVTRAKLAAKLDGDSLELSAATTPKSITDAQLAPAGKYTLVFP